MNPSELEAALHYGLTRAKPGSSAYILAREVQRLRAIADAAGALMNEQQCEGDGDLRVALDAYQSGAGA